MIYNTGFFKSRLKKDKLKKISNNLILRIQKEEKVRFGEINLIYCGDKEIRKINKEYLGHDYETDIITFHDTDEKGNIEGELLISTDTVKRNSESYSVTLAQELFRVTAHGLLHLCGYDDKTRAGIKEMREKENYYLKKIRLSF
ncbi:MAG: Endoribonuclease YbeY [Ignavibacteria bacterium]|nr:Endoribonuclease YbeY [Ignavibacteria bacterium]